MADGKGGTASDNVTIQVVRPARKEIVFEDVHFDFDRYSLRPEATRALDEAIKTLQENADLRLEIEGHTCNIGTAEYNLALGERRAQRCANTWRAAASVPIGCAPSATARSVRSTTTRAKRHGA